MSKFGVGGRGRSARVVSRPEAFALDRLEDRVMLATVFWDGGAGTNSWQDKNNWSTDTLPGPGDDVVISVQDDPTVTFTAGQATVASISTNESFSISGGSLSVTGDLGVAAGPFTVGGGTLSVAGMFGLSNTELRYNAGTLSASPNLTGGTLKLGGGASPVTFILGGNGSMTGNIGAGQTVWIRGSSFSANASITATGPFTNAGTIRLESIDLAWDSHLTIASGALTNSGAIEANLGSGGPLRIFGTINNQGSFKVQAGAMLSLELAGGHSFSHTGSAPIAGILEVANGPMTVTGGSLNASGELRVRFGSLSWTGGTVVGDIVLGGAGLTLGPGAVSAANFVIHGSSTIIGNIAKDQTVWVQGSDDLGQASLTASASFTSAGLIRIESVNSGWDSAISLTNNAVLTNTGVLQVGAGSGGTRSISGKVVNIGEVFIPLGVTLFAGAFTQGQAGRLRVEIGGTDPGQFGLLDVTGAAVLAGEFEGEYVNGFTPEKFDSIRFLAASSVSGEFDTLTLPFIDPDPDIKTLLVYSGSEVRLLVTSTADMNNDGTLDLFDFLEFVNLFNAQDPATDFTGDGIFDLFDFLTFFNIFNK